VGGLICRPRPQIVTVGGFSESELGLQ